MSEILHIEGFSVENYRLWKGQSLDIENGATLVSGFNRSGKTLLFRALDHALWGASASKRGSYSSKQPARSVITVRARRGRDEYKLVSKPSSFALFKNGKDIGTSGVKAGREELGALLPIPKSLYDATVHLSGTTSHPLSVGTPAQRMAWFGDVLGINASYDLLLKKTKRRYEKVKHARYALKSAKEELRTIHIPEVKYAPEEVKRVLDRDRDQLAEAVKELELRSRLTELKDQLTVVVSVGEMERILVKSKKWLQGYREALAEHEAYEEAAEQRAQNAKDKQALIRNMRRLKETPGFQFPMLELKERRERFSKLLHKLQDAEQRWVDEADAREELRSSKQPVVSKTTLIRRLEQLEAACRVAALSAKALKESANSKCPTCGGPLHKEAREKLIVAKARDQKRFQQQIDKLNEDIDYWKAASKVTVKKEPSTGLIERAILRVDKAIEAKREFAQAKRDLEAFEDAASVAKKPKPVYDSEGNPVKNLAAKVEEMEDQVATLTHDIKLSATISKLPKCNPKFDKFPNDILKQVVNRLRDRNEKHERLHIRMVEAQTLAKQGKERKKALLETISKLKKESVLAFRLELLMEAFGPKGLRLVKIRERAEAFVRELNRLAPIMWGEPFTFAVDHKEGGFDLTVERNGEVGDLTTLSGSENKCWQLLSMLALLRMLPATCRVDVAILDEIEANMDEDSRYRFARNFVPELLQTVPKVIIVTPLNAQELPLVPNKAYTVTKKDGVSSLRCTKGHVNNVIPMRKPSLRPAFKKAA